jgi:hypothetical protein
VNVVVVVVVMKKMMIDLKKPYLQLRQKLNQIKLDQIQVN